MDRPKWMPEETIILEIQDGGYIDGEVDNAFRRTGLRAQITVLEEIIQQPAYDRIAQKIAALRKELENG